MPLITVTSEIVSDTKHRAVFLR